MSLCINPSCSQPDRSENEVQQFCQTCRSELLLQGRYRVMRLLNDKSGFGTVYEAFERKVPKLLKVLKAEYNDSPKAIELFRQEATVLSQLSHPSIPAVESDAYFQYLPHVHPGNKPQPLHCLVMEKIDGLNLREWMRQQGNHPIGEKQALNWLKQLVEVLHLVHQKNYFHRDIKPENIMLRSTGQIVLVDFGAAREMTLTYLGQVGKTGGITRISSAGYTPPEQEKGQAVPQSDFYALGCTLIYLVTGNQPTDVGMYDYFNNEFTWREHAPHLSPGFADFLDRLVANRVSDRPKDTQEILTMIPKLAAPTQPLPPTIVKEHQPEAKHQPQAPKKQTPQGMRETGSLSSGRIRWLCGGAIALTLAAGGSYGIRQNYSAQLVAQFFQPSVTQEIVISKQLEGHKSYVNCLTISPDGATLASGSADNTIALWDMSTGQPLKTLTGHTSYVNAIAITPDGKTLVSGSADNTVKLWDLAAGKELKTLVGHQGYVNALDISPDGKTLATVSADKTIRLWDLATGITIRTLKGHADYVNALIFSPDGRSLFTSSADQTIKRWDLSTGQDLLTLRGHTSYVNGMAISTDGKTLFSSSADQTIKIWDLTRPDAQPRTLKGHTSFVNALALKPDGKTLISGGGDQTLKVWDVASGRELQTLKGYGKDINYFVVSPEWDAIATGSASKVIKIWPLKSN
jgi:serine/threonine protein kinase